MPVFHVQNYAYETLTAHVVLGCSCLWYFFFFVCVGVNSTEWIN